VSYFRPRKARKIGLRSIHSLLHSTQKVSQKGGRVTFPRCARQNCLTLGVHSSRVPSEILQSEPLVETKLCITPQSGLYIGHWSPAEQRYYRRRGGFVGFCFRLFFEFLRRTIA
jgi:hypothetical protein